MSNAGSNEPTVPPSQTPTASVPSTAPPPRSSLAHLPPGAVVSRYRIVSVLGEGGMGTVYLARQEKPDRQVALKVVRPGYATDKMLRRFEHESEVLGRLLHPGIAQIYEAGVWANPEHERRAAPAPGHAQAPDTSPSYAFPFFAMELVKGPSLTEYARQHKLSTRQRLELLAKVCDAVQHAHQKGVIHRDLKPGNILVTDDGQPKILDFGVARATDSDIQQTTMQTDVGALVGTIPYMSPEQVGGDPNELDTRSDVYALGVIAYELLAGRLPYDLQRKMIHEVARIIREDEPTRLSSIDRTLRGDVETIVAHALEKDKARRYGAASALAADIRRYLSDEPIAARPASTWYQVAKFSRRNRALVVGVAATFVVLIAGIAATGLALKRESEQRALAEANEQRANDEKSRAEAEAERAKKAEAEEKKRADELKQVSDFQADMLAQVDATEAGYRLKKDINDKFAVAIAKLNTPDAEKVAQSDTLRESLHRVNFTDTAKEMIDRTILKPAVDAIDRQFIDQPLVDAQLRQVLANRYRDLGLYDAAYPLQDSALKTRRRMLGEEHPSTLVSISRMGFLLQDQGKLAEAEPYYREALEKYRRELGEAHPYTLTSIGLMGSLLLAQGRLTEAEPYYREALEKHRRVLGDEHPDTLASLENMGFMLRAQGKIAEAESYYREALEKKRRVLGEEHPDTLGSINNMGLLLQDQGRFDEAERYCREAVEKRRRTLGESHPETLVSISNMGLLLQEQGKLAEAEPYYREALDHSLRVLGDDHPDTLVSISNMGTLLRDQGRLSDAEPYYREALEKRLRTLGESHPDTLISLNNLGVFLRDQGRLAEAEPFYLEALEMSRRVLGEEHPNAITFKSNLGVLLRDQGKLADAEPYLRGALEMRRRVLGESHPDTLISIVSVGTLLAAQARPVEAIELLAPAEPAARRAFTGANAVFLAMLLQTLGQSRIALPFDPARFTLADSNLNEAHMICNLATGQSGKGTLACAKALTDLFTAWDKADPGKGHDARAAEWKAKLDAITPAPDPATSETK